ncbi:MAG: hypothetical protein ACYC3S_04640 [Chloroflexota bacterium]
MKTATGTRRARVGASPLNLLAVCAGLLASAVVVAAVLYGLSIRQGAIHRAEMRATYNALPVYPGATAGRTTEHWGNLVTYWQSEGVLPRVVGAFRSDHPVGAVVTFYKENLTAAGWQEYREPWSLYPAYRKGPFRLAILFQQAYAQDWLPAGDYQVHLWSLPLLEQLLGRDLGVTSGS